MPPANIGVVITTYNSPDWLEKVLIGYEMQSQRTFKVIIADDGSGEETAGVVKKYAARGILDIDHVWHEDQGFRKCQILNKAIASTNCDYLIFTDGDCIPDPRFIETHQKLAEPGYFLSGGYIKLTMPVSLLIQEQDIRSGAIFEADWLVANGQPRSHKLSKLSKSERFRRFMNRVTPTAATWNGMNSSTWTQEIIAANGFNEDMQYGGLDRELGERLWNRGIRSRQIRYSTVCLHLDHERGYSKPELRAKNDAIRRHVKKHRVTWTPNGIIKGPAK